MTIEELWQSYAASVGVPVGGVQWQETRRAFYAGAMGLLGQLKCFDGDEDAGVVMLQAYHDELRAFVSGVRGGTR